MSSTCTEKYGSLYGSLFILKSSFRVHHHIDTSQLGRVLVSNGEHRRMCQTIIDLLEYKYLQWFLLCRFISTYYISIKSPAPIHRGIKREMKKFQLQKNYALIVRCSMRSKTLISSNEVKPWRGGTVFYFYINFVQRESLLDNRSDEEQ